MNVNLQEERYIDLKHIASHLETLRPVTNIVPAPRLVERNQGGGDRPRQKHWRSRNRCRRTCRIEAVVRAIEASVEVDVVLFVHESGEGGHTVGRSAKGRDTGGGDRGELALLTCPASEVVEGAVVRDDEVRLAVHEAAVDEGRARPGLVEGDEVGAVEALGLVIRPADVCGSNGSGRSAKPVLVSGISGGEETHGVQGKLRG